MPTKEKQKAQNRRSYLKDFKISQWWKDTKFNRHAREWTYFRNEVIITVIFFHIKMSNCVQVF